MVEIEPQELESSARVGQSAANVRELFQTARDLPFIPLSSLSLSPPSPTTILRHISINVGALAEHGQLRARNLKQKCVEEAIEEPEEGRGTTPQGGGKSRRQAGISPSVVEQARLSFPSSGRNYQKQTSSFENTHPLAASHLFSTCLADELLVASLFLKPWPFDAPSSRITGFLRWRTLLGSSLGEKRFNYSESCISKQQPSCSNLDHSKSHFILQSARP